MSDGRVVALRDLSQTDPTQPENSERNGELVSSGPGWADLELTDGGAPILPGTLVGFQTSETIYLGHVESGGNSVKGHHLRVRIDHFLSLQDVSSIQKVWSEQPD